ncbi:MAG: hypothetical protein RLZ10_2162 [Bacteroidota bacterium]|jgi:hypothetical protein
MKKRYWHRLSQEKQSEVFQENLSTDEFWQRFKAPEWCGYHRPQKEGGGLRVGMPPICTSLIKRDRAISKKVNCSKCQFCKK